MSNKSPANTYAKSLLKIAPQWSKWDEFTQWRRKSDQEFEIIRSSPTCLILGILMMTFALGILFLEAVFDGANTAIGVGAFVTGAAIFPYGRGVIVDGYSKRVTRWWGWIPKPLFRKTESFSEFKNVLIVRKLGPKGGGNTGRTVRRPIFLVMKSGRRIPIKPCRWRKGADALAEMLSQLISIPIDDQSPVGDSDE